MKKIMRSLVNKAICAAFVVLGAVNVCAEGVNENITVNDTQYNATSEKQPSGKINYFQTLNNFGRMGFEAQFNDLYAERSLIVKVYDAEGNQLTETKYQKSNYPLSYFGGANVLTCSMVIGLVDGYSTSSTWGMTEVKVDKLTVGNMPAKVELWVDDELVDTRNSGLTNPEVYQNFDFVYKEASVGSTLYASLDAAVEAAGTGAEVVLLANVSADLSLNKSITLQPADGVAYTGTITLTAADAVLTAPAGLNVVTTVANSEVKFENGAYTVVEAAPAALTYAQFNELIRNAAGGVYDGNGITVTLKDSERSYQNNKTAQFFVGATNVNITDPVETVKVSNVNFVFEDDDTDNAYTSGELQVFATYIEFTGCTFNGVAVSPWGKSNSENAETATFTNCTWKDLSGRYGIHQNRASNLTVTNCKFENCERGIHTNSSTVKSIVITGNTFTGIGDSYGVLCLAEGNGDLSKATLNIAGNGAEGQVMLRQLSSTVTYEQVSAILDTTKNTYGTAYVSGSVEPKPPVAKIGDVTYATLEAALAAAQDGDTVYVFAGDYTRDLVIDKDITVIGETTGTGYQLAAIWGQLQITADGATVKGFYVYDGDTAAYVNAKDVLIEGCELVGAGWAGLYQSYTDGTVTFKDSTIVGATYGINFDGSDGGNIIIDNCKIQGWTSFASTINNVAISNSEFAEGYYNQLRFYQNAQLTNVTFNENMTIDFGKDDVDASFSGCSVENGGSLLDVIYLDDIHNMGVDVTIDDAPVVLVAKIGDKYYTTLQEALDAAAAGTGNVTVEILSDIDLAGTDWNPVTVSAPGYPFVTVNGNNKTIKGLNDMLFAGTWAGKSGLVINDLTIADSTIVHDENDSAGNIGVGAFVGYPQASATVTLNNCHLKDSTVKGGHWTGGLVGIAGGYNGTDGPVFMTLTIDGCSVTGSTITGNGSAGGIIGHGSCSAWTDVIIVNSTVSNNTITSTGSSNNKAGSVMGTIGAAGQPTTVNGETKTGGMSVSVTTADNTVKSADKVITTIYGRQGTETGLLEIAGGTYEAYPIEENIEYAAPKDGYIIFENADGKYGVKEGTYVAQINGVKYETLASALAAAQDGATVELLWAEGNAPIAMNGSVYGKSVTITGTATVDWSKGFLFVGRGGEGDGTVIFDNANLESASNNASTGIHVSGREKNTNNKYDGTVVVNNSTIELDYLIDKGAMTMTNSTLTVKNGFAVGGRPASETESGVDATATFDLTNGSTLIVNNHNGMGLGYEAIGVMTIDGTSTFECTLSFLVTDKGVLKSAGNVFGDIDKSANAQIELTGGIYTDEEVPGWCAEPYAALPNLNDQYVVGVKPTATVNNLGAMTIPEDDYIVYGGSKSGDMPLSFVMQFLADQTEEDMKTSPYADWYGDFVITFTGIENGSFTADGCYLAGHYGDFGWVKVPVDGMTIENGARYPVMLGVGLGQKYDYICSSVEDFKCAMFLTPEIIEANPNLKVKLELAVVDNSQGSDSAASALVNNDKVFSVTEYEYGAEAFAPALPTATVTPIDAPEGTPLTFALNFKADEVTDAQLAYYGDWYADFVLTITGLPEEGVTFNANGTADGYLAGQYDAWSENWVSVPFEDVTLRNGESIKIMEYAATLMGQPGLKLTYNDVYSFVKDFNCGVYFTPEFLAANPDMKVSLSLRMYKTGDATDEGVAIGEMEQFSAPVVVAKIGPMPYATLEAAIAAAGADDTVTLLKNVGTDAAIQVAKKVTIDLNGKTIATTQNDKSGDGVFHVVAGGDLTIEDGSADKTGTINGVGGNNYNISVWADGGKVTINGGNFTNVGATDENGNNHFDLIYAKNGGVVVINGGKFECESPAWTLNIHDGSRQNSSITVNGGTFVGFDPRNNAAETAGTTFMAPGKYTLAEGGSYSVVTPTDYILNGAASDAAAVDPIDAALAGAVTVTKDGDKITATATYTFKVTAVDTVNPEKSEYELTGGTLRPGKSVKVKYIDLENGGATLTEKPASGPVIFKLVID